MPEATKPTPIDGSENPPLPGPPPDNYLTRDIEITLERGVAVWIDAVAFRANIGRREAAVRVAKQIARLVASEAIIVQTQRETDPLLDP